MTKKPTRNEQMQDRICSKGIRYTDLKVKGLLTQDQIASIPEQTIYEWVSSKLIRFKDFQRWLNAVAPYED